MTHVILSSAVEQHISRRQVVLMCHKYEFRSVEIYHDSDGDLCIDASAKGAHAWEYVDGGSVSKKRIQYLLNQAASQLSAKKQHA